MRNTALLHDTLAAIAPVQGVRIGRPDDKATWSIDFAPEATPEQQAAATTALLAFDPARLEGQRVLARDIIGWFEDRPELWVKVLAAAPANAQAVVFLDTLRVRGEKPIDMGAASFVLAWGFMAAALGPTDANALMAHLQSVAS